MIPLPKDVKLVLYGVLDWGLGHATRSIPVIRYLLSKNIKVIVASDGNALKYLQNEFPSLSFVELRSYKVTYQSIKLSGIIFRNIPNILQGILSEKKRIRKLLKKYQPDLIISDSRFGFRSKRVTSYIITHQLCLYSKSQILSWVMNIPNTYLLKQFDRCLIPDSEENTLSGALSTNKNIKQKSYIGPLSRLKKAKTKRKYFLGIILSGPEPARTKLENRIIDLFSKSSEKIIIARGCPVKNNFLECGGDNFVIVDNADSETIQEILLSSEHIICRAGYSSVMDLYLLNKSAFLIPTPGQSEQEYLGQFLDGNYGFRLINEDKVESIHNTLFNV